MPDPPDFHQNDEPQRSHDDEPPRSQDEDRDLNLDESDDDEPELIDNSDSASDDENRNSQSSQIQDRPRRGNVYFNNDSFMKGRYVVLEAKPVDEEDQNRAYECCLCQLRY